MPDRVKEKLVELCEELESLPCCETYEGQADYLIANGVTVQEKTEISDELLEQLKNAPVTILQEEPTIEVVQQWISVKDRLPEKNTSVFGYYEYGRDIFWYDEKGFNVIDEYGIECPIDTVTHWMPLPEPPAEDK